MSSLSIDHLRRRAKDLRKSLEKGDTHAKLRVSRHIDLVDRSLKHADYLHVVAREAGFESWPKLKFTADRVGLDRHARQRLLRHALFQGQSWKVEALLAEEPDLARDDLACLIALYDKDAVRAAIKADPACVMRPISGSRPFVHLAFSRHFAVAPEKVGDMIAIAELLLSHGGDVNDVLQQKEADGHGLSLLYGALGHAHNMLLAEWLLDHGADPDDGEALYHATELGHLLGHHRGLEMLLAHGAKTEGTNALLRALDFNDHTAVRMLIEAGARVEEFHSGPVGGEAAMVIPVLHQAARRLCDRELVELLLEAGADPHSFYKGASVYGYACAMGCEALISALEDRGLSVELTMGERCLRDAARGEVPSVHLSSLPSLPEGYRDLLHELVSMPERLDHIKRLVAIGFDHDRPGPMGLTPVHLCGWQGLSEGMAYFLSLGIDLSHRNDYGGSLLGSILHGAEHCTDRHERDHLQCLRMVLDHGVPVPRAVLDWAGNQEMEAFLADWAEENASRLI